MKPNHRMKTVVKIMEKCLNRDETCEGCEYTEDIDCMQKLMADGLYYLQQTLEKSKDKESRHR